MTDGVQPMNDDLEVSPDLVAAVEALLFAAPGPIGIQTLVEILGGPSPEEVARAIDCVSWQCGAADRGLLLAVVDGGWQFRTQPRFSPLILRLRGGRPAKLTRPALEVLSVVAYRQPVTRHEIEAVRGVDSGGVLKTLMERNLVRVSGRREEPGRPLEYATTPEFLALFSLPGLQALPTLREREELLRDQAVEE